jgi:hypothetical protein
MLLLAVGAACAKDGINWECRCDATSSEVSFNPREWDECLPEDGTEAQVEARANEFVQCKESVNSTDTGLPCDCECTPGAACIVWSR